jgi:hypothetical protein
MNSNVIDVKKSLWSIVNWIGLLDWPIVRVEYGI